MRHFQPISTAESTIHFFAKGLQGSDMLSVTDSMSFQDVATMHSRLTKTVRNVLLLFAE